MHRRHNALPPRQATAHNHGAHTLVRGLELTLLTDRVDGRQAATGTVPSYPLPTSSGDTPSQGRHQGPDCIRVRLNRESIWGAVPPERRPGEPTACQVAQVLHPGAGCPKEPPAWLNALAASKITPPSGPP